MTLITYSDPDETDSKARHYFFRVSRILVPFVSGGAMTIMLLYMMQSLISSDGANLNEAKSLNLVDFVRVAEANEVQVKDRKPPKPPEPEEVPPAVDTPQFNVAVNDQGWSTEVMDVNANTDMSNSFGFISDGNYLPIVKVQPVYPRTALVRGLGGWVVLEFTVDKIGRVIDPVVLDNCAMLFQPGVECEDQPNKIFDQSALRAAVKFKYKPKVEDGVAVATYHVRHKIVFELDEE